MSMLLGGLLAAGTAAAPLPAASAPPPGRDRVMSAVRAEWPAYDQGSKGRLTPLEFSTWVMKSHGGTVAARAHAAGITPVSAMNASATAFARADVNHDGGVTPDEMAHFLMTAPQPTALAKARAAAGPAVRPGATATGK